MQVGTNRGPILGQFNADASFSVGTVADGTVFGVELGPELKLFLSGFLSQCRRSPEDHAYQGSQQNQPNLARADW
jgi:hypothetical protein